MFKQLLTVLKNFASFIEKKTKEVFRRFGKDATGKSIQSLESAVDFSINAFEIVLTGGAWIQFIENGRPAGSKLPPEGSLLDWMRARGIAIANEFVIRRAIAVNGIEPTPVIETSFFEVVEHFNKEVAPDLLQSISKSIAKAIKKGFDLFIK